MLERVQETIASGLENGLSMTAISRLVIAGLADPTKPMIEAGYEMDVVWREGSHGPADVYRAMLQSILQSKEEGEGR